MEPLPYEAPEEPIPEEMEVSDEIEITDYNINLDRMGRYLFIKYTSSRHFYLK